MDKPKTVELRLGSDGSFSYRGELDHVALSELTYQSRKQAEEYRRSQHKQDPLAIGILAILVGFWITAFYGVVSQPAPSPERYQQEVIR